MPTAPNSLTRAELRGSLWLAAGALICAGVFAALPPQGPLPVLGSLPLLSVTAVAALAGPPLLWVLRRRRGGPHARPPLSWRNLAGLLGLGAALAVPPVLIDVTLGLPRDLNLALPGALFFYPAVALVAEVALHLIPLALLALIVPRGARDLWWLLPVLAVEPALQAAALSGPIAWYVAGAVALVSAAQLWLFQRYGFAAMLALRLSFYLFWHILWGTARLALLF